jgi:hypothetical protein
MVDFARAQMAASMTRLRAAKVGDLQWYKCIQQVTSACMLLPTVVSSLKLLAHAELTHLAGEGANNVG